MRTQSLYRNLLQYYNIHIHLKVYIVKLISDHPLSKLISCDRVLHTAKGVCIYKFTLHIYTFLSLPIDNNLCIYLL